MKSIKFKEANNIDGKNKQYINHSNNTCIMKFKPSFWDIVKMIFGFKIWVGTNISGTARKIDASVRRTAFLKEDD